MEIMINSPQKITIPTNESNIFKKIETDDNLDKNLTLKSEQKDETDRYKIEEKELLKKLDEINKKAEDEELDITFEYNKEINRTYISIVDKKSGKVIEKLPSESAMKFFESMNELVGMILDKKG